ncbi:MAG: alpha/beta hydrolase [Candidatus Eisenbacteria bacterium]|uniref:Alpha/beta hydrolase n=1 Tax=Eiseniibacteriota bacterium TaxID=2212470 RepID=A0A9D6QIW9_UNCEI|nr:alpha/beta hydrolase [Candidatus Eisenbacteria bacterium]MBI3539902.1 alpha/beta hydrolase [Candidatus Eisenbacteria bacterium]
MAIKGGRLEFLAPHVLRSQLLRPGFVRLSLRIGVARQMPAWARLQFTNAGVSPRDLDHLLRRVHSLSSWVDEWESLGREHEQSAIDALALGRKADAARHFLAASSAYNFSQYVIFLDKARKRALHDRCVRAYAEAAPLLDPPAVPFEVAYRRHALRGFLRRPPGPGPAPVAVLFNGTNAVKEEMHWWGEALLERGVAVITFDGPGLGSTWPRMTMVAEPRPAGVAILNQIEATPGLDGDAVAFFGMSLGGYLAIRMATHDTRVRAVAAVSPPYSAEVYWKVTLAAMRRELAGLYDMDEREMGSAVDRITLRDVLPRLRCPLLVAGGGHDLITPGEEAWRIFEGARCERELIYYPSGAHDCFNVLADLRPRIVAWISRRLEAHRAGQAGVRDDGGEREAWIAAEAVDPDFADALRGDAHPLAWNRVSGGDGGPDADDAPAPVWRWPWTADRMQSPEVVHRFADAGAAPAARGRA